MEGRARVVVLDVQRYGRLRVPKYFVDPDKAGELYAAAVLECFPHPRQERHGCMRHSERLKYFDSAGGEVCKCTKGVYIQPTE